MKDSESWEKSIGSILNAIIPALEAAGIEVLPSSVDKRGLDMTIGTNIISIRFFQLYSNIKIAKSKPVDRTESI